VPFAVPFVDRNRVLIAEKKLVKWYTMCYPDVPYSCLVPRL
jgi:hypothetical protein